MVATWAPERSLRFPGMDRPEPHPYEPDFEPDPPAVERRGLELLVALAYAADAMARDIERDRAAGLVARADLTAVQLRVIDDFRHGT